MTPSAHFENAMPHPVFRLRHTPEAWAADPGSPTILPANTEVPSEIPPTPLRTAVLTSVAICELEPTTTSRLSIRDPKSTTGSIQTCTIDNLVGTQTLLPLQTNTEQLGLDPGQPHSESILAASDHALIPFVPVPASSAALLPRLKDTYDRTVTTAVTREYRPL